MDDVIDKRYMTETKRPLDPCFIETEKYDPDDHKKIHLIRASRPIVLSQDDPNATLENTMIAAKGEHLRVCGDRVRVAGRIELRGLNVSINCRELEFVVNSQGNPEIDVTGEDGAELGTGVNVVAPEQPKPGTEKNNKGKDGTNGAAGDNGNPGKPGGTISIACHTLKPLAPVTLATNGGKGGAAVRGQDGGQGGDGLNGLRNIELGVPVEISESTRSAKGGQGGNGGNGGDGGVGGKGGQIELYCLSLLPSSHAVNLCVAGGDGGLGGMAGSGGQGGKGGTPADQVYEIGAPKRQLANGANGGGGGAPGLPGFGGTGGDEGTLVLRCPKEALKYPAKAFAQQSTGTLRLVCRPGAPGKKPDEAKFGDPGTPGDPSKDLLGIPGEGEGNVGGHEKNNPLVSPRKPPELPVRTRYWETLGGERGVTTAAAQASVRPSAPVLWSSSEAQSQDGKDAPPKSDRAISSGDGAVDRGDGQVQARATESKCGS